MDLISGPTHAEGHRQLLSEHLEVTGRTVEWESEDLDGTSNLPSTPRGIPDTFLDSSEPQHPHLGSGNGFARPPHLTGS